MIYIRARRELLFDRFRELWTKHEQRGTWERLDRAARKRIEDCRELRRAQRAPGVAGARR
jgi:hypothetical protein